MGDTEDDARYPPNTYGMNNPQQDHGSSHRQKLPVRSAPIGDQYVDDDGDEDEEDDEELGEEDENEDDQNNGVTYIGKDLDEDDDDDDEGDEDDTERHHQKKRKLKSLISSYEFAPRVPAPAPTIAAPSVPKTSVGGRNSLTDWTERETFVLLDAWGDRFLQRGRKSLRSEEWQEVADKVLGVSKIERTDTQCRNRLDTLKKKYKKEKINGVSSNWVYFKKMDVLMVSPPPQQEQAASHGLSCGLDSGEYVFTNPKVYVNRGNGAEEMRDSPGDSESTEEDVSDGLPPKKRKLGRGNNNGSSFGLIVDSIKKFSDIYEKIETSKRKQMVELEKMRMDLHRELEMQKKQIMERAQAEIVKIRRGGGGPAAAEE